MQESEYEKFHQSERAELEYLRDRVKLLHELVENFPGGLMLFDSSLRLAYCNKYQREMMEYPDWFFGPMPPEISDIFWFNAKRGEYGPGDPEELVRQKMHLVERKEEHVFERRRPNGRSVEVRGTPLSGGGFVTTYLDVTLQRRGNEALEYLANHDVTTNLPNRHRLLSEVESRIAKNKSGSTFAVIFIDLDKFKPVNDQFGHATGDELLRHVGRRLIGAIRSSDQVSRFGGDEFVIVMDGNVMEEGDLPIVDRILKKLCEPFTIDGNIICIGASVGVSIFPEDGTTVAELLEAADKNMYFSKRTGRRPVTTTDRRMHVLAAN